MHSKEATAPIAYRKVHRETRVLFSPFFFSFLFPSLFNLSPLALVAFLLTAGCFFFSLPLPLSSRAIEPSLRRRPSCSVLHFECHQKNLGCHLAAVNCARQSLSATSHCSQLKFLFSAMGNALGFFTSSTTPSSISSPVMLMIFFNFDVVVVARVNRRACETREAGCSEQLQ